MAKGLTKTQLMQTLADKTGMTKKDVMGMWDALTELAYSEVNTKGELTLPGLGKLVKKDRAARMDETQ